MYYSPSPSPPDAAYAQRVRECWRRLKVACGIGLLVTVPVLVLSGASGFESLLDPSSVVTIFLPTYVFYTTAILTGINLLRRPSVVSAITLFIAAVLPAASWLYSAKMAHDAERVKRVRNYDLTGNAEKVVPATLVETSGDLQCRELKAAGLHIERVISADILADGKWVGGHDTSCRSAGDQNSSVEIDQKPPDLAPEYLLFSSYNTAQGGIAPDGNTIKIELYFVSPTKQKLLAYDYQKIISYPSFPPILTVSGWYEKSEKGPTEQEIKDRSLMLVKEGIGKSLLREEKQ